MFLMFVVFNRVDFLACAPAKFILELFLLKL